MIQDSWNEEFKQWRKDVCVEAAMIPKRYIKDIKLAPFSCDVESFDRLDNIKNKSIKFINNGYNLLIYSTNTGNGKTTWACKIAKAYIDSYAYLYSNTNVIFINVAEYLTKKKQAIDDLSLYEEIKYIEKNIMNAKLVIWDDIAIKVGTEYDKECLYSYINSRLNNDLSNIFTSNILPNKMQEYLGERVASRIVNESVNIELIGPDRRGNIK